MHGWIGSDADLCANGITSSHGSRGYRRAARPMSDARLPACDLVVSAFTPTVDRGRALRTYGVVAALACHRDVDVIYKRFGAEHPAEEYARLPRVHLREVITSRGARRALVYTRARLAGVPPGDARGFSRELSRAAVAAAAVPCRGRVIADGPVAAAMIAGRGIKFVYLAHNVESSLRPTLPRSRRVYASFSALRRFERRLLLDGDRELDGQ